ncbi:hypothetical protein, partial [Mesorhizobium sp.]|uniref:hypothetical protein n=1 Tax=Mesorhizobium sp. TaxID=1871066 RepID=UPI0025C37175
SRWELEVCWAKSLAVEPSTFGCKLPGGIVVYVRPLAPFWTPWKKASIADLVPPLMMPSTGETQRLRWMRLIRSLLSRGS